MTIAAMQLAAGRGDRLRIDPQTLEYQIERVAGRLKQQLVPVDAKAAYAEGMQRFQAAELAAAESEFTRAIRSGIEIDEAGAHCYLMRGLIRARSGDSESAVADFNRAQQLGEDGFELYFLRGMNHYLLDLYRAAEDDLTQAQTRNPDIADVYLYRGLSRVLRGDYESALQDLDTAQTLGYSGEALYQNRAYAYVRLGRLQEAAKEVETARTLAPESVWTRSASAGLLLAQKRYAEALAELKPALQSEQNASLYFELGLLHLMMLQSGEALQAYAEGLQTARQEVIDVALRELEYWRPHIPPALRAMITEWLDYRID
jgi:tetratricopeptide (TPR) repeat protein